MNYTIGQRRGLGLGAAVAPGGEPLYVVKMDARSQYAGQRVGPRASALATKRVFLRDVNWIGPGAFEKAATGAEIAVRVRSTRPPAPALLEMKAGEACVEFLDEESGVAPGQACVCYDNTGPRARVLGGGIYQEHQTGRLGRLEFAPSHSTGGARMKQRGPLRAAQLETPCREEAYARWAPVHDLAFTAIMAPGRRAAVAAARNGHTAFERRRRHRARIANVQS